MFWKFLTYNLFRMKFPWGLNTIIFVISFANLSFIVFFWSSNFYHKFYYHFRPISVYQCHQILVEWKKEKKGHHRWAGVMLKDVQFASYVVCLCACGRTNSIKLQSISKRKRRLKIGEAIHRITRRIM